MITSILKSFAKQVIIIIYFSFTITTVLLIACAVPLLGKRILPVIAVY